jgi:long-chain acyl-CoA synthetase
MSVLRVIRHWAATKGEAIALANAQRRYSYRELAAAIDVLAQELKALDAKTVALRADNSPEWIVVDLACQAAGLCLIPLPTFFSPHQYQHALRSSGANLLIEDGSALSVDALTAVAGLTCQRLDVAPARAAVPPGTSKITYTSGSTSEPKGVCLSAASQEATAASVNTALGSLAMKDHLAILPLATLLENVAGVYSALLRGACVFVPGLVELGWAGSSGLDIDLLAACFERYQPDSGILLPQILKALNQKTAAGWTPPASLRFLAVGGARVAPAQILEARAAGLPVYEGYGLSECASVLSLNTPEHDRPGSAGKPLSHAEFRFVDGELCVSGNSFLGYLGDADGTTAKEVATGDLAELDEDGFLQLRGRRKNLLVSSYGRNISPEWLESELLAYPGIAQCIVVGDDQPFCSALILRRPGYCSADIDACIAQCNSRLPDYAQIRQWRELDTAFTAHNGLLTANGRLRRGAICQHYADTIAACYSATLAPHYNERSGVENGLFSTIAG